MEPGSDSKQHKISPAKDILKLKFNLEVYNGLSEENMAYHVPLFMNKVQRLEASLAYSNAYNDTFYLMGQTGTGKTTIVDYLFAKSEKLKKKYVFIELDFTDERYSTDYFDDNFNSIELFLVIFARIFEVAQTHLDPKQVEALTKKLKGIEDKQSIQHQDIALNKWSFADFLAEGLMKLGLGWNVDMSRRETTRRLYQNSVQEVMEILNELIATTAQQVPDGKTLLLFLDGLEKLRSTSVINKIFNQENAAKFRQIQCRKLIVKPVDGPAQVANMAIDANKEFLISTKVFHNPLDSSVEDKVQDEHIATEYQLFKAIVTNRIAPDAPELIEDDALRLAIEKSGGILSDYLAILISAVIFADVAGSNIIRTEHVEGACRELEGNKSVQFIMDAKAIKLLYHVLEQHTCPNDADLSGDVFLRQLLINNLIIGKNGVHCFYVHPLIQKTVAVYGKPRSE